MHLQGESKINVRFEVKKTKLNAECLIISDLTKKCEYKQSISM